MFHFWHSLDRLVNGTIAPGLFGAEQPSCVSYAQGLRVAPFRRGGSILGKVSPATTLFSSRIGQSSLFTSAETLPGDTPAACRSFNDPSSRPIGPLFRYRIIRASPGKIYGFSWLLEALSECSFELSSLISSASLAGGFSSFFCSNSTSGKRWLVWKQVKIIAMAENPSDM